MNDKLLLEDRVWASPWTYVALAVITVTIIGELVWIVR